MTMHPEDREPWQNEENGDQAPFTIPGFAAGGRVERTGIALVHEGEYIMPAPGSEAVISPTDAQAGQVVNYYFPIEIEVVGALSDIHLERIADRVFTQLDTALRSLR
jgi:hypothetical protein